MRSQESDVRSGSGRLGWPGRVTCLAVVMLWMAFPGKVAAQYTIVRSTVSGGSMQLLGGTYSLRGTAGQPGTLTSTGGNYSVTGGFWFGPLGPVGVDDESADAPLAFRLHAATPNPLIRDAVIAFDLPESRSTSVRIYDVAGRLARTLQEGRLPAGPHRRVWDGTDDAGRRVGPGIYFVRLDAERDHAREKIVVVR